MSPDFMADHPCTRFGGRLHSVTKVVDPGEGVVDILYNEDIGVPSHRIIFSVLVVCEVRREGIHPVSVWLVDEGEENI